MTDQLVFPTSPPTWCWVCGKCRPVGLCGSWCIKEEQ